MFVFFFLTYFPLVSPQTQQTCPLCAVSSAWNAVLLANSLTSVISSITFYVSFLKQYLCLSTSHGWRSLVGYSPWGGKESDTLERLTHYVITGCIVFIVSYLSLSYYSLLECWFCLLLEQCLAHRTPQSIFVE